MAVRSEDSELDEARQEAMTKTNAMNGKSKSEFLDGLLLCKAKTVLSNETHSMASTKTIGVKRKDNSEKEDDERTPY